MKKNLGNADRIIRLCIAGVLALLWFQNIITGTWGIVALAVAAVFVLTSFVSWCPLYAMFGIKSTPKKQVQ
ncbi:YgaP family membrane protein [Lacibacter sediminis]|jgi:Protein of unknown function (DUF2892)|uniref:DUF2892 domain-containing protein n=1 Tax=Lacibacter sediminis TaxID=2760713 RepID=A0A7G5XJB6_9BACT|nr:DUF2892 domain-containing protein [Lacibacter sediminis]QNA45569.1 DUF2892 domain-containing protein [Lacibacter sediminis]